MDKQRRRVLGAALATALAIGATAADAARKGSKRVGGSGSSGKGGKYVGGRSSSKKK